MAPFSRSLMVVALLGVSSGPLAEPATDIQAGEVKSAQPCYETGTCPPANVESSAVDSATTAPDNEKHWVDHSRDYVATRADSLTVWMDSFFGEPREDEEAPYSNLRLRLEQGWDEVEGADTGVRLRGKVHLPALNHRLSLLFNDDDGDNRSDDLFIDEREQKDDVALQYKIREHVRDRLDFKLGLRSSLDPKASLRYRYRYPYREDIIGRFTEEIYYRGDDGFGAKTRVDIERALDDSRVLELRNLFEWGESTDGVDWSSSLSLNKRLASDRAIIYYISVSGVTRPETLNTGYGIGIRYRESFFRPWLFYEVQPGYSWRRPTLDDNREGAAEIVLRLEAFLKDESRRH